MMWGNLKGIKWSSGLSKNGPNGIKRESKDSQKGTQKEPKACQNASKN